jgi:hypothetical protein
MTTNKKTGIRTITTDSGLIIRDSLKEAQRRYALKNRLKINEQKRRYHEKKMLRKLYGKIGTIEDTLNAFFLIRTLKPSRAMSEKEAREYLSRFK